MATVYLDLENVPDELAVLPSGEILLWSWSEAGHQLARTRNSCAKRIALRAAKNISRGCLSSNS